MNQRSFIIMAGLIFFVIAILHMVRIVLDWSAVIGGWDVPEWVSWVAFAVAVFLAYEAFKLSRK